MAEARVPAGSRAVLIGVSDYADPGFPPIRAARNSLRAMQALLTDPSLCGWPPGQVTVIEDPASAADLAGQVDDLAESTSETGALLLYYVGHGALSRRGELCLTVTSTRSARPKFSGLPWEYISEILRDCRARARLVILDCCFAGQAIEALSGDGDPGLADIAHVEGVYTLTATARNRTAHVPSPGQQDTACTSFTGELRDLVRSGIPGKPAWLTFSDIYPALRYRLHARTLPAPNQRGTDTAYQFPFTANAAARTGPDARGTRPGGSGTGGAAHKNTEPARTDWSRAARVLDHAARIAQAITDNRYAAPALAMVAGALAAIDPDRAARLGTDAERIAQFDGVYLSDEHYKIEPRARAAKALAVTDPDRAERIAQSITDKNGKTGALAAVAGALAATDPDRAERIAQSITDNRWAASVLAEVAGALAVTDPDRAERIAQSITDKGDKVRALAEVAGALAATDPDRAERIAQSITHKIHRARALAVVAGALAATDPDRAERIARTITGSRASKVRALAAIARASKVRALAAIARALAATDPDRAARLGADAERIAQSITDKGDKVRALAEIARALAATDPDRAARLGTDAERIAQSITDKYGKEGALAAVAGALAATDPDRAERITRSIDSGGRGFAGWNSVTAYEAALHDVAGTLAITDPDRAEDFAHSLPDVSLKVEALVRIAEAWSQS